MAPLVIPILTIAGYVLVWTLRGMEEPVEGMIRASANFAALVTVIGYGAMVLFGIPATVWLLRADRLSRRPMVWTGTIIGALPVVLLALRALVTDVGKSIDDLSTAMFMMLLGAGYGAATGFLASMLIWRKQGSVS